MSKPKPLTLDQVSGEMQGLFGQVKEHYGLIPNAIALMARAPEALKAFMQLRKALNDGGILEQKYKELVWLKASSVNGCLMWARSHYASAKQTGITNKQIKELPDYHHSKAYDEKEMAAINWADLVTRGAAAVSEGVFEELGKHFSDDEIVEMTLMICLANFNNRFTEGLRVDLDEVWKLITLNDFQPFFKLVLCVPGSIMKTLKINTLEQLQRAIAAEACAAALSFQ